MRQRTSYYRNLDRSRALLMAVPFGVAAFTAQNLHAVDHTVADLATLRAAIDAVNASSTNDRIFITDGTITITGAALDNANASGDLDITKATGNLEIIGGGVASTILDGGSLDRVFHLLPTVAGTVTIRNLTIRNGLATDDGTSNASADGGGILHQGGDLVLENVTLTNNQALGANGAAGAAGTSSFPHGSAGTSGRQARGGGAYSTGGALSITNVTVSQNIAQGGNGGQGGAGHQASTSAAPGGNGGAGGAGASGAGGGIYADATSILIASSTFSLNQSVGGNGGNGGVGGSSSFSFGRPGGAGGAGGQAVGGGAFLDTAAPASIYESTFNTNDARGGNGGSGGAGNANFFPGSGGTGGAAGTALGGSLSLTGTHNMSDCTFSNGGAVGGNGGNGGNAGGGFSFGANGGAGGAGGASAGGAIHLGVGVLSTSGTTIDQATVAGGNGGNGGTGSGGFSLGSAGLAGAAGIGEGGAIGSYGTASVSFWTGTISGCVASGGNGGNGGNGPNGSTSGGNGAFGQQGGLGQGGGIFAAGSTIEIVNSTIANCSAIGGSGGNGGNGGNGSFGGGDGGAGGAGGTSEGGGVVLSGGTLEVYNSTIASNTASGGTSGAGGTGGSAVSSVNDGANGTAGAAAATTQGGGIYIDTGTVTLDSTILADNTAGNASDMFGTVTANDSLIEDVTGANIFGSSNLHVDPQLGPLQNNGGPTFTMAIAGNSPARNTGSNQLLLSTDQRGQARDDGNGVDMGAFERQPNTSGGGGKKKKDEDCSTGTNPGGWSLLAALGSLFALAMRRRRRTE